MRDAQRLSPSPSPSNTKRSSQRVSVPTARVVTASNDKTARVWDARSGQPLTEPLKHEKAGRLSEFQSRRHPRRHRF